MSSPKATKLLLSAFILEFAQLANAAPIEAESGHVTELISSIDFFGGTYSSLSAKWWQWVHALPKSINPIVQNGPVDCSLGQRGHTWFLAGTTGGTSDRTCSVPHHTALFFPLIDIEDINYPGDCGRPEGCTVAEKRQEISPKMDAVCELSSTLDGVPVVFSSPIVRTQTPPYEVVIGSDDVFDIPAGIKDSETIADGYWILIPYLTKGNHELYFKGSRCDPVTHAPKFTTEVTYHLQAK